MHDGFDLPLPMIRHVRAAAPAVGAGPGTSDAEFSATLAAELEAAHPGRGPRHGGGVHRRAGAGRRGRDRAAGVVLPGHPGGARPPRRAADRRRGRHRLRPSRRAVRDHGRRHGARPDHRGEGHHLGLRPAVGLPGLREGLATCWSSGSGHATARSGTATPTRRTRSPRRRRWPTSTSSSATSSSSAAGTRGALTARAAPGVLRRAPAGRRDPRDRPDRRGGVRRRHGAAGRVRARRPARRPRSTRACLALGVITRALPAADTIAFSPPFATTEDEIVQMVQGARAALDDVCRQLA